MAATKTFHNNNWENAGKKITVTADRSVSSASVAAGWHTEYSKELTAGCYILQAQFTLTTTEATTLCLLISKDSSTSSGHYARATNYVPSDSGIGLNVTAVINENDFDGQASKTWTMVLWNNKAITRTSKAFVVTKLD